MDIHRININLSSSYEVLVGRNIINSAGIFIGEIRKLCKVLIISDNKVFNLYGDKLKVSLENCGFTTLDFVVERGEGSKSLENFGNILEYMAKKEFHRDDIVVALGGGVVGDLAGFIASVYNRGIDFVQIPTTFLSAIDSSVGGKTAINLKSGKNLVGAFKQPKLVICDLNTFNTLEEVYFKDGIAEAIKYAILKDENIFEYFENNKFTYRDDKIKEIVIKSIEYKREIVKEDEYDTGLRQLLNLGHTIGHAIEMAENFNITHGHAVGIGTYLISLAAYKKGYCEGSVPKRIKSALIINGLEYETKIDADKLYKIALKDKKVSSDEITLVLPEKIGKCKLVKVKFNELYEFIKLGKED